MLHMKNHSTFETIQRDLNETKELKNQCISNLVSPFELFRCYVMVTCVSMFTYWPRIMFLATITMEYVINNLRRFGCVTD